MLLWPVSSVVTGRGCEWRARVGEILATNLATNTGRRTPAVTRSKNNTITKYISLQISTTSSTVSQCKNSRAKFHSIWCKMSFSQWWTLNLQVCGVTLAVSRVTRNLNYWCNIFSKFLVGMVTGVRAQSRWRRRPNFNYITKTRWWRENFPNIKHPRVMLHILWILSKSVLDGIKHFQFPLFQFLFLCFQWSLMWMDRHKINITIPGPRTFNSSAPAIEKWKEFIFYFYFSIFFAGTVQGFYCLNRKHEYTIWIFTFTFQFQLSDLRDSRGTRTHLNIWNLERYFNVSIAVWRIV